MSRKALRRRTKRNSRRRSSERKLMNSKKHSRRLSLGERSTRLPMTFLIVRFQTPTTSPILRATTSWTQWETKGHVDLAILFHSHRLLNQDSNWSTVRRSQSFQLSISCSAITWMKAVMEVGLSSTATWLRTAIWFRNNVLHTSQKPRD